MYRAAQTNDKSIYCSLWNKVFHDPEEFAEIVFDNIAGQDNIFVCEQDSVCAILSAIPVTLSGHKGYYWYGLATDSQYEKQGIMTELMKYAASVLKNRGAEFFCLIPASPSLFEFYRQRGFQKAFEKRVLKRPIKRNLWAQADFDSVTVRDFLAFRSKYFPDSIMFDEKRMVEVIREYYRSGITIISSSGGYGIYFCERDKLHFIELAANSEREAEFLLEAARDHTGLEDALIEIGACQDLFLGEGSKVDYGMILFAEKEFDVNNSYMRLMLD